jgi:hypothetical protein
MRTNGCSLEGQREAEWVLESRHQTGTEDGLRPKRASIQAQKVTSKVLVPSHPCSMAAATISSAGLSDSNLRLHFQTGRLRHRHGGLEKLHASRRSSRSVVSGETSLSGQR